MASIRLRSIVASLLIAFVAGPAGAASAPKASVMIVGISHLQARRDFHNSPLTDSPLAPKRQGQIADIVAHLARYHPTKVLVEESFDDPKVRDEYRRYVAGRSTLGANEVYQYGFKLAARSGNAAIYPVDADGPSLFDASTARGKRIISFLRAQFGRLENPAFTAYVKRSDRIESHGTYLDTLQYLNTNAAIEANASSYAVTVGTGRDVDSAGATYVAQWYARNCFIFANILGTIRPGDRVAVIFGQGHEYLLREFVRLNPNLVDVDPLRYLK